MAREFVMSLGPEFVVKQSPISLGSTSASIDTIQLRADDLIVTMRQELERHGLKEDESREPHIRVLYESNNLNVRVKLWLTSIA